MYKVIFIIYINLFAFSSLYSQQSLLVNLSDAKKAVKEYYLSGQYDNDMKHAVDEGLKNLEFVDIDSTWSFVFDIDETCLSNWDYQVRNDFGYVPEKWNSWIDSAIAKPIKEVKRFYDTLTKWNLKIIFITGRNEKFKDATLKNLNSAGFTKFEMVVFRAVEDENMTALDFKTMVRRELVYKGFKIAGTIGDQLSDIEGGYAIIKIKLPNYIYTIK